MAKLDTDRIWRALGTFMDLFPQEERIYLSTFWSAFADLAADMWGLAFQIDRSKSLFETTATFERRNALVVFSGLQEQPSYQFALSSVQSTPTGAVLVRGFVPREARTFKATDVPSQGIVRIGVDILRYDSVNVIPIVGGQFDGYVREATFTLAADALPHDYSDTIDMNDGFFRQELALAFRVNQVPGQTAIDATSSGQALSVNATGRLRFGTPGLNFEQFEYKSVSVVGDRYVFTLPATFGFNETVAPTMLFPHALGEEILVSVLAPSRWEVLATNAARVYGDNAAVFVIDNEPGSLGASTAKLRSLLEMRENVDFDLSVTLNPETWGAVASGTRRAGMQLAIGANTYTVALATTNSGHAYLAGLEPAPSVAAIPGALSDSIELRIARTSGVLEFSVRDTDAGDFVQLAATQVTGERARMALFVDDSGTDTPATARFDEVVRRLGEVAGSTRLETSFEVTDLQPFRYTCDAQLTEASGLRDDPRLRRQSFITVVDVTDTGTQYLRAIGDGDDFKGSGVPPGGELVFGDTVMIYDEFVRDGSVFEFKIRNKIDPSLLPMAVGSSFVARTRELTNPDLFSFPAPGEVWLRELPTRDRMWAPVAQEDQRHIQKLYGPLVGVNAEVSTDAYLRRVQGVWYALMSGPAIENVHIGVHLTMGLPVAKASGVVQKIFDEHDELGRLTRRAMVILGEDGAVTHDLNTTLHGITWAFAPGQRVEKFTPLTKGVQIYDTDVEDAWPDRFGMDPTSPERYNAFGVLVDMNVLTSESSLDDAIRFCLRIKPTTAKMIFHLLLTAGNERLHVEDDGFFAVVAEMCEDISFDEGPAPVPPQSMLRMGDGHKMGQGKHMGESTVFRFFPVMGIGLHMGTGLTMSMDPRAFDCRPNADNLSVESLSVTPVVTVEVGS